MDLKLTKQFYSREDVLQISKELLGKVLVSNQNGIITSGIIVEVEAYAGEIDKAAHVFGGKRTKRTETMYGEAGHAYIYFCYGIHSLINVVTNKVNIPTSVLIRALEPLEGIEEMMKRRKKSNTIRYLCSSSCCNCIEYRFRSVPFNSVGFIGVI